MPALLHCSEKTDATDADATMNDIGKSLRNQVSDSHQSPRFVEAESTTAQ
jgi:hypothetical protein